MAEIGIDLGLRELRLANAARQAEWCPDQVPDLSFRGNELAGETGEACNVIKKLERERHGWRGSRDTIEHLGEELADVVICADLVAIAGGIDLAAHVVAKFNASSEANGLATRIAAPSIAARPAAGIDAVQVVREHFAKTQEALGFHDSAEKLRAGSDSPIEQAIGFGRVLIGVRAALAALDIPDLSYEAQARKHGEG